jgi:hypothetical protein
MGRRSALRPEEEPVQERTAPAPPARTAADGVLALQRSAGNRAVSAMLAREPTPADAKAPPAAAATATLSGIGTIPLLSVNFEAGRGIQPPVGRGADRDPGGPREIVVTSRHGKHSSLLAKAAVSGGPMTVEIVMGQGKLKLTLENALISSYSTSGGSEGDGAGGLESWALNFSAMKQERQGESE